MTFQESETSSAEAVIHHRGGDPILLGSAKSTAFSGKTRHAGIPCLTSLTTSKPLGAAGTWSVQGKPSQDLKTALNKVSDDDWIDLVISRHGSPHHVMRGLVDEIRGTTTVVNGATVEVLELAGRDFVKVWEKTPVWFNRYTAENVEGAVTYQLVSAQDSVYNLSVDAVVDLMLRGFLSEIAGRGRANWQVPDSLPGAQGPTLIDNVAIRTDLQPGEVRTPERYAIAANFLMPDGDLWQLAREWSDPMFCELWADLEPRYASATDAELRPEDSQMAVHLRDRPFPRVDLGRDSPWFSLPLHVVARPQLLRESVGRSGLERYNAFFVSPQIMQATLGNAAVDLVAPLWDPDDIAAHGLCRFDVNTRYVSLDQPLLLSDVLRERVRDWHCLNPYLYSGTLELRRGRPEIRAGSRVRVPGVSGESDQATYYVEQANQSWAFGVGARSTLGVTRGWVGSDNSLLQALQARVGKYLSAIPTPAGQDTTGVPFRLTRQMLPQR